MTSPPSLPALRKISRNLSQNLLVSMRVAGPPGKDGQASPLRSAALQRSTGIARSTLRTLRSPKAGQSPNPDLHTLSRLAQALGVPVAFLLMRPEDWEMLCGAINNLRDPLLTATRLIESGVATGPDIAEQVLKQCRVHPISPPLGGLPDQQEQARLAEVNERVRRRSHVLAALMQPPTRSQKSMILLTALAAALANQNKLAPDADESNAANTPHMEKA